MLNQLIPSKASAAFTVAALVVTFSARSSASVVFSSVFSDANNVGSVGGDILDPSGSDVNINKGPWQGTYNGILSVLLPPFVSVALGSGSIGDIAGINLASITDNSGWLFQETGLQYQAETVYTLTADVSTGSLVSANVLSDDGVGIGLTRGSDISVGGSADPGAFVSLTLLSGTTYQLTYQFATDGSAPSGDIGVRLFDQPAGLLTANLITGVTFSNVSLDAQSVPEPASLLFVITGLLPAGLWKKKDAIRNGLGKLGHWGS